MNEIISLKKRNKSLRQQINSAKTFIAKIHYLYSDFLLHDLNRNVVDQKTFDEYQYKLYSIQLLDIEMKCNSKEILKLRESK